MSEFAPSILTLGAISRELSELVRRTMPSVVSLHAIGSDLSEVSGSGFLFDDGGHIVTNYHVVEGRTALRSILPHSGEVVARLVGVDPLTDLAVLAIDNGPPEHLQLRATPPQLGELCIALGSPLGEYTESVCMGIVSGLGRSLPREGGQRPLEHAIQTDAAINHGNSGGPLVDMAGLVIGVNQSGRTDAQDISFAVPAEIVSYVAREILAFGGVQRAALGVAVSDETPLIDGVRLPRLVVTRSESASTGGLQMGDVLLTVADVQIRDRGDLFLTLSRDRIDQPLQIEVYRAGLRQSVIVTPKALKST
jgi:serine protease Do